MLPGNSGYLTSVPWESDPACALIVDCSQQQLGAARAEFLLNHLGIHWHQQPAYNLPGGAAAIASQEEFSTDWSRLALLLENNPGIKVVVGMAHANCAHYRSSYPDMCPEDHIPQQRADLSTFRERMANITPVQVRLYIAMRTDDGRVEYVPVD